MILKRQLPIILKKNHAFYFRGDKGNLFGQFLLDFSVRINGLIASHKAISLLKCLREKNFDSV